MTLWMRVDTFNCSRWWWWWWWWWRWDRQKAGTPPRSILALIRKSTDLPSIRSFDHKRKQLRRAGAQLVPGAIVVHGSVPIQSGCHYHNQETQLADAECCSFSPGCTTESKATSWTCAEHAPRNSSGLSSSEWANCRTVASLLGGMPASCFSSSSSFSSSWCCISDRVYWINIEELHSKNQCNSN